VTNAVNLNKIYSPSEDVVAREIEGEIIIVPLVGGIGDMEDELFTLNETGKVIWKKLDGNKKLFDLIQELREEFEAPEEEIKQDLIGLVAELLKRKILIEST
jgi:hypothetical protein